MICLGQSQYFGAKRPVLAQNYIQYQHISIQSTMNPSAERKTQLKFRYQIQYTNEISDNDFFQLRSHAEIGPSAFLKNQDQSGGDQRGGAEQWKSKTPLKKKGKDQPIVLVHNHTSEENNSVKMEQQQHSIRKVSEDKSPSKIPNKHTTPKKGKQNVNACLLTTAGRDGKGSSEEEARVKTSRKGLAWISSHILQLLEGQYRSDNRFTCGEISDKVLTDFYATPKQKAEENTFEEKEKKTIRRRVYDSINVLIALGKIKKAQKYLYVESIDRRIGEQIVLAKKEKIINFKKDLERKESILTRAKNEYAKLIQLKTRNEELSESKEQGYSGTFSTFSPSHSIYRFPLLLAYGERFSKMRVDVNRADKADEDQKDQIVISSDPFLYLLSDLSCLEYLTFPSDNRPAAARKEKQHPNK